MGENGISISEQGKEVKKAIFDDADLLSEEEKAAMADDDEAAGTAEDDDDGSDKTGTQEGDDDEKAAEIAKADKAIADEKAKAEGSADQKGETDAKGGGQDDADSDKTLSFPQNQPPVMMDVMSPEDVQAVKTELEESRKKFNDGEIDYDTYFDKRLELERKLWANEIAIQISSDGVENQWQWEQQSFLNHPSNSWINGDDVVYSAFAATVNRILGSEEGATLPGPALLEQARKEVAARFSPTQGADRQAAEDDAKKAAALKGAKTKQAGKAIPDTLANIPAAEIDEGAGEFEYLDKLDGDAYEKAVEALSPAQLERYENSR